MSINPYQSPESSPPLVAELVVDESGWTIDFEIAVADLVAWNLYCHRHVPVLRRSFIRGWIFIGVAMATIVVLLFLLDPTAILSLALTGSAFLAMWSAWPWFYRFRLRRLTDGMFREGANPNVIGPRRVSLLREYLIYATPMSQTITRWAGIERVINTEEALYILLSNTTAIPVPRRAFASVEQFEQFAKAAADFHANARPSPVA